MAQDSSRLDNLLSIPDKLFAKIQKKSKDVEDGLTKQTEKYLQQLARREQRLKKKLEKTDSVKAKELFGNSEKEYAALQQKLYTATAKAGKLGSFYNGHLDSLQGAFKFLDQGKFLSQAAGSKAQIDAVLSNYQGLQNKLDETAEIKKYLEEGKQYLKQQLQGQGLDKEFNKYRQEMYYYRAQLEEYKNALNSPEKLESKLLELANKIPAFSEFFRKNSILTALFPPQDMNLAAGAQAMQGLQTRAGIEQLLQAQLGAAGPNALTGIQQNLSAAQSEITQLKEKISKLGTSGGDIDMPDFKPRSLKTKSFFERLEYGTNIQTQKSNAYFPTTTDLALHLAYRLSGKSNRGIGASYKMGWGQDIQHVAITAQGFGIRSFGDIKIKSSFYASGGFEYNYQQPFNALQQLYVYDNWQKSGLIGISKILSLKTKVFRQTKFQLLWDFLSYQQIPRTQAIKFRVGYSF
jgi:hypothetical protein